MSRHWNIVGLVIVVLAFGWAVLEKEALLATGDTVFLELLPKDPRSLMQGDYMILRYRVVSDFEETSGERPPNDGTLVLRLDQNQVGHFLRIDEGGQSLQPAEIRVRYRIRNQRTRIGAESFFFEEGSAPIFRAARYGEVKVSTDGEVMLIGLRDRDFKILGQPQRVHSEP